MAPAQARRESKGQRFPAILSQTQNGDCQL